MGTTAHSTRPDDSDVLRVASIVNSEDILSVKPGRSHTRFRKISVNPLSSLKKKKLMTWIERKIKEAVKFSEPQGEGSLSDAEASDDEEACEEEQSSDSDESSDNELC